MDWMSSLLSVPGLMSQINGDPMGFATSAAAAGVPPPPLPTSGPPSMSGMPPMGPTMDQMNGVQPSVPAPLDSLGSAMEPQATARAPGQANLGGLAAAARPQTPQPQRVGTPSVPRPTQQIKTGELLALLQALGGGGIQPDPYRLPSTLGAAMGGR
jgi:hypothetical protein